MVDRTETLSERENKVLRLLLQGHDAKSTAHDLAISVHSVNERLRSARRKLGVSSSREAARLLGHSEQGATNSLGHKPLGLSTGVLTPDKDADRRGLHLPPRPIMLALGGTLLMSLIVAAVILSSASPTLAGRIGHITGAGSMPSPSLGPRSGTSSASMAIA